MGGEVGRWEERATVAGENVADRRQPVQITWSAEQEKNPARDLKNCRVLYILTTKSVKNVYL